MSFVASGCYMCLCISVLVGWLSLSPSLCVHVKMGLFVIFCFFKDEYYGSIYNYERLLWRWYNWIRDIILIVLRNRFFFFFFATKIKLLYKHTIHILFIFSKSTRIVRLAKYNQIQTIKFGCHSLYLPTVCCRTANEKWHTEGVRCWRSQLMTC